VGEPEHPSMHWPDEQLAALVDCRQHARAAFDALLAHRSQVQNFFMVEQGPERFVEWFGRLAFAWGREDAPSPAAEGLLDDLFSEPGAK